MAAAAQHALLACAGALALTLLVLAFPALGGYGWPALFSWNLHPTLLHLAIMGALPYGMLQYRLQDGGLLLGGGGGAGGGGAGLSRAQERLRHGAVQGAGLACALAGYAVAYTLHELKGHAHLPALHKPWFKQLHIYGGLAALAALLWQAALGVQLTLRAGKGAAGAGSGGSGGSDGGRARGAHSAGGFRVWAALVAVSLLGLYMPLVDKAAANRVAPLLFALLAGAHGFAVALVARALPVPASAPSG